ncbi:hypothetical protein [Sphingomonas sp. T9W2]|uniref:hypothetical protein n=1 Tax=Sphingomonas sp. T9W2 TaxID=3143183 RepID=UPI0031F51C21
MISASSAPAIGAIIFGVGGVAVAIRAWRRTIVDPNISGIRMGSAAVAGFIAANLFIAAMGVTITSLDITTQVKGGIYE